MPVIDVGMSYEDAEEMSKYKPAPENDYKLQVRSVGSHKSEKGNTVMEVEMVIIENPEVGSKVVRDNPTVGFRSWTDFCKATGYKWEGRGIVTEELVGLTVGAHVGLRTYKDKNGENQTVNQVVKYFAV